jgi:diapolycopene oxygenase
MRDYVPLRALRPHWRCFFEDGETVNLDPDPGCLAAEARRLGEDPGAVERFLEYSGRLYDLVDRGYFQEGLDTLGEFVRFYGLRTFPQFDLLRSMHGGVARHLKTRYFRDVFDFFIKYVGSSATQAPAFMNCLPTIQFRHDLWYVDGGMYGLARGLGKRLDELGVNVHLNAEVAVIRKAGARVAGITLADGRTVDADIVVSNLEVVPAYERLLQEDGKFLKSLWRFEPACSGLVIDLGLDRKYPQLAHHNFFMSGNQRKHFDTVFRKHRLPDDPTLYVVAASRTDATVAPVGCDGLKILPHIPYIDDTHPLTREDYLALKDRVLDKLERMGLEGLRKHVVCEHVWTPHDIRASYGSNKGSIYGVVSDRFRNLSFKAPKHSTRYENLWFVGGSVNPGGGMPMVVLSGRNAARRVVEADSAPKVTRSGRVDGGREEVESGPDGYTRKGFSASRSARCATTVSEELRVTRRTATSPASTPAWAVATSTANLTASGVGSPSSSTVGPRTSTKS